LMKLQSKIKNDWNLKLSNDTLSIESKNYSWIDFYNSAGAPMDDPELNKFTDEYLQKNGKKTKMKIVFHVENKWDSVKIKNVLVENKKIQTQADSLIYKYKLSHLKRTYRYNEELIWGATKDEEKRFEEYKKEKAALLKKIRSLPTYNSSKYSLFIISRTWVYSEDNYYMLPKIYPESEDVKTHELENILDSILKK
ncbi:MAG TPA: hypothetical protein VFJ43_01485, partial [Bacteroidia bacterium]|nr:hypothetical protein [Bacteroidia bacterium]